MAVPCRVIDRRISVQQGGISPARRRGWSDRRRFPPRIYARSRHVCCSVPPPSTPGNAPDALAPPAAAGPLAKEVPRLSLSDRSVSSPDADPVRRTGLAHLCGVLLHSRSHFDDREYERRMPKVERRTSNQRTRPLACALAPPPKTPLPPPRGKVRMRRPSPPGVPYDALAARIPHALSSGRAGGVRRVPAGPGCR